ncbi:MAG: thioredoxin family protein [Aquincola sp.]|nr:thioredoxin family protein [Aquincola sp.]MDH4288563.1 thioredoxin family protein [Aquincola sp.]MDH5330752.1 thioredoxin family protein [Aquincola sp.]
MIMFKPVPVAAVALWLAGSTFAATVGQSAPAFTATDAAGKAVSLADFKGRTVVLEWVNPGCPYVRKHYDSANMQAAQRRATDQGVVWLAVNSTAQGHYDYRSPAEMAAWMQSQQAAATATLMDSDGKVGRAFGARTTPHMYIVDAKGTLVYAGGIDDKPSSNAADVKTAKNHVNAALADIAAGKPVAQAVTRPYGCSIKYSDG